MSGSADTAAACWHPSPNFGPRRDGLTPSLIVIHYTAMASASAALQRLCDPSFEVSAHYLIGGDGTCWQMVAESQRAWHAGAGEWNGQDDINSRSIGIELDNLGNHPFSEPQMARLEELLVDIMTRWAIPSENVIGHSCMAPGRKHDPGPHFDWARLAAQSLAIPGGHGSAPQNAAEQMQVFRSLAQRRGFTADVDDETLLQAVRLRFRSAGKGPLAPEDFSVLGDGTC
ncbi:N-acetylmuramoyl-L-alanine amidase [Sedimentitalea sp. CY04]|uniref:N-acetylmuramoyl-L-alanine amidase n=1 Tax=Parasedimentitalea denitrificans TaxID=2211118 RepID=A0ABX0W5C2_9RHOB|nr:N-acetylmuramoyl-L-alanine amidase [Sedimentitalea sp. CY04]NIZ60148.1 N-acetylmuramoyl-L-alanine amidase [Sedimentitalea sp. CY04]